MLRKVISIYIALFATVFIYMSCGCPPEDQCLSYNNVSLTPYDASGEEPVEITGNTSVLAGALMLEMNIDYNWNVCYHQKRTVPFINSAFAFTCKNSPTFYNDTVKNVIISADRPYSDLHPAGTGLNEFFDMPKNEAYAGDGTEHIFQFYAVVAPNEAGDYTFRVTVYMSSGRKLESICGPVNIVP